MKRLYYSFAACLLIAGGVAIVSSCNQEDDYDDFECNLDVAHHTSLRRSSMLDHWESGSGQTLGGNGNSVYTVPTYKDECLLWAIVTIAAENHIPITVIDGNGNEKKRTIGYGYTSSEAYDYLKGRAQGQTWMENDVTYTYSNGAMPPSIAEKISQKAGILQGKEEHFNTFRELYEYISKPSWIAEHKKGTYMISNNKLRHTSVCKGVKNNKILLVRNYDSDASQPSSFTEVDNSNDGFVLIY